MSWAVGYDTNWNRDIGYGVPSICDHPDCNEEIHRGLAYVCGDLPYGGEHGCGLFFCDRHLQIPVKTEVSQLCERCIDGEEPFEPTPDTPQWICWKLMDSSWHLWRQENPKEVARLRELLRETTDA